MARVVGIFAARMDADMPWREIGMIGISARVEFDRDRIHNTFIPQTFPVCAEERNGIVLDHESETLVQTGGNLKCKRGAESRFEETFVLIPCARGPVFACRTKVNLSALHRSRAVQKEIGTVCELPK